MVHRRRLLLLLHLRRNLPVHGYVLLLLHGNLSLHGYLSLHGHLLLLVLHLLRWHGYLLLLHLRRRRLLVHLLLLLLLWYLLLVLHGWRLLVLDLAEARGQQEEQPSEEPHFVFQRARVITYILHSAVVCRPSLERVALYHLLPVTARPT